ncbi:MAG TPA: hypothetical protein VG267_19780 [Terracidiphilus sp.]|jgi:hypothetical protein|nr:hypothetical protein [Terracidiphilus sp.]
MFDTPDKEWRRLTEHYSGMYDEEVLDLARDYTNLTEMAQQVLRDEMKKRGLGDPSAPRPKAPVAPRQELPAAPPKRAADAAPPDPRAEQDRMRFAAHYSGLPDGDLLDLADDLESLTAGAQLALGQELERRGLGEMRAITESQEVEEEDALARAEARMSARQRAGAEDDADPPAEYTWKVPLSEYETRQETWQRYEMLRRAGIESWLSDATGNRLQVAADQLEEAQHIVEQPVPADIVEQSQMTLPEFEMPKCPSCHAADPVLIDTVPINTWLCESCGKEWAEPAPADTEA